MSQSYTPPSIYVASIFREKNKLLSVKTIEDVRNG